MEIIEKKNINITKGLQQGRSDCATLYSKIVAKQVKKSIKTIKNDKSKTDKLRLSGVYELSCGSCEKVYVGQTGVCLIFGNMSIFEAI